MKTMTRIATVALVGAALAAPWGASAVQAAPMSLPTITINAVRTGSDIAISGTSWQSSGSLTVMVRRQGESGFTAGTTVPILTCYNFTWNRHLRAGHSIVVYVTDGTVNSNRLRIEPAQIVSSSPLVPRARVRAC